MRVFVTGGTGFLGRAVIQVLRRHGHEVVVWARSEARARSLLGADMTIVAAAHDNDALANAIAGADAIVNLAGEPILGKRWTESRRAALRESRVGLTQRIVQAIQAARQRPRVLVSGSAVGFYGDRGDEVLTEDSAPGSDFLASLGQEWERAAAAAESLGVRVVRVRTGVVLGKEGGALAQMLPPFRLGLGGPVGSGMQYMPWIHLHDYAQLIATAVVDSRYTGAINGVTDAVTGRIFARALGRALHRPAVMPVPRLALTLIFGDAASVLLGSQRVRPERLEELGFRFAYANLDDALADIVGGVPVTIGPSTSVPRSGEGWQQGDPRPTYELKTTMVVHAPVDEAFGFFSQADNLGAITPPGMQFVIDERPRALERGATIRYRLKLGPVPIRWRTTIAAWDPERRFVDLQASGPYRMWWHEHVFRQEGGGTRMDDRVLYTPPLGPLGRVANVVFIAPALKRIFQYRGDVIRLRFGASK